MKKLIFGVAFLFGAYLLFDFLNHNFDQESIHLHAWPKIQAKVHTPEEIQKIGKILDQPFAFLGKGRQIIAFASQDGKYVLKFIRCNRFKECWLFDHFPLPRYFDRLRQYKINERKRRYNGLFTSLNLCEHDLVDQTGTLFCHITPTQELHKTAIVTDRFGFSHKIDLDSVPFVIQKRAKSAMPVLQALLKAKNYKAVNERLDQLIQLIVERARRGIRDPDSRLLHNDNVGYLEDRAIYIDNGTFFRSYESDDRPHLQADFRQFQPIVALLKTYNPKLAKSFKKRMQLAVNENIS